MFFAVTIPHTLGRKLVLPGGGSMRGYVDLARVLRMDLPLPCMHRTPCHCHGPSQKQTRAAPDERLGALFGLLSSRSLMLRVYYSRDRISRAGEGGWGSVLGT